VSATRSVGLKEASADAPAPEGGHFPTLGEYLGNRRLAQEYDEFFRDTKLFGYDCKVLDELFARPGRLIDLGCGTGRHLVHFAGRGFSVTGVDLSDHMIDLAGRKTRGEGLSVRLVKADICDLAGFEDGSYDYAIAMFSVLGLVRGEELRLRVLRGAARILAEGGLFVFHVHNILHTAAYPGGWKFLAHNWLSSLGGGREFGDQMMKKYRGIMDLELHSFTPGEIRRLVARSGLTLRRMLYLNPERDGELQGGGGSRAIRANGFIVVAGKERGACAL